MKWFFTVFFSFTFIFLTIFGVNCFYGYLFPIRYTEEVQLSAETFDVDQSVIYSVINVESGFNKNAVSIKGAQGLMQIMPSTAQELALELKIEDYDLKNPEDNIFLGSYYLSKLNERFDNLDTALAAYNAGPTNVSNWLKDERYSDDGKTLKEIPFAETKNYLEKFYTNYKYYSKKVI